MLSNFMLSKNNIDLINIFVLIRHMIKNFIKLKIIRLKILIKVFFTIQTLYVIKYIFYT